MPGTTRTARPARRALSIGLPLAALVVAAACTHPGPPHPPPTTTIGDRPPAIVVEGGGRTLSLQAFTFCWVRLCADGRPPTDPPDLGRAARVTVRFPMEGWRFTASLTPVDGNDVETSVEAEPAGPTTHRLVPGVRPGTYDVLLFGAGPLGEGRGDVVTAFRWTVTGP